MKMGEAMSNVNKNQDAKLALDDFVAGLRLAAPLLDFDIVDKASTAYVDEADAPQQLVGINIDGALILDFFSSESGMSDVDPEVVYGVPKAIALEIKKHNQFE
jgi:hypothetical protein